MKYKSQELRSFQCTVDGDNWTTINTFTSGMAKSQFYHDLDGEYPYINIRCRVVGLPFTSEEFQEVAKRRNIEFAYCGMNVKVGDWMGVIVGYNSSLNISVLITDGNYKGQVMNCHPHSEMTYYDKQNNIIASFVKDK